MVKLTASVLASTQPSISLIDYKKQIWVMSHSSDFPREGQRCLPWVLEHHNYVGDLRGLIMVAFMWEESLGRNKLPHDNLWFLFLWWCWSLNLTPCKSEHHIVVMELKLFENVVSLWTSFILKTAFVPRSWKCWNKSNDFFRAEFVTRMSS